MSAPEFPSLRGGDRSFHGSTHAALLRGAFAFAAMLFVLSHSWLVIVRRVEASPIALLSSVVQQLILWGAYCLVDRLLTRRWSRFLWAAAGTLYASSIVLDALLMRITSLPLREILPMAIASEHVVDALREIGLKPVRLLVLAAILLGAATGGGLVRLLLGALLPRRDGSPIGVRWSVLALLALAGGFTIEQALSRDDDEYLGRALAMPTYVQLYRSTSRSVVLPVARPVEHAMRARWLERVGRARNPHHVLYVLLESFRADLLDPAVCPAMARLEEDAWSFDNAVAEATSTPLSWSVLLFDEAADDDLFGRHPGRPEPLGSWLLAVMRKAGYDVHVSFSTNLAYARTHDRLVGGGACELDLFQAAGDGRNDPADKNGNDRVAVDHLVHFISEHVWDDRPQFLLLQLDSTHYAYPFPEEQALFVPYTEIDSIPPVVSTAEEELRLNHRYLNAAHFVDAQLGRVLHALERAGVADETVVVLTADHGEDLSAGFQGHAAVNDESKRVPLFFRFPGRPPARSRQLISHRDILPTLADYLGIAMPEGSVRGRSAAAGASQGVLTLAPSGRIGELTTPSRVVELSLQFGPDSVVVTPAAIRSGGDTPGDAAEWLPVLAGFFDQSTSSE